MCWTQRNAGGKKTLCAANFQLIGSFKKSLFILLLQMTQGLRLIHRAPAFLRQLSTNIASLHTFQTPGFFPPEKNQPIPLKRPRELSSLHTCVEL